MELGAIDVVFVLCEHEFDLVSGYELDVSASESVGFIPVFGGLDAFKGEEETRCGSCAEGPDEPAG